MYINRVRRAVTVKLNEEYQRIWVHMGSYAEILEKKVDQWESDGVEYVIMKMDHGVPYMKPWFNGYAVFPLSDVAHLDSIGYEEGMFGQVNVHGGMTYCNDDKEADKVIWGFDCAHAGDETNPQYQDMSWLRQECERMGQQLKIAIKRQAWIDTYKAEYDLKVKQQFEAFAAEAELSLLLAGLGTYEY